MKQRLLRYLESKEHFWWSVSILPGIYCLLYLYTNNYTLVSSWYQLVWCVAAFVLLPALEILILDLIFKKWLPKWRPQLYWTYLLMNFGIILSYIIFMGWRWKALLLLAIVVTISSFFVGKHYKKLILLLGIMNVVAFLSFVYFYVERVASQKDWVKTQEFETFKFKQKPNVYVIQPDGFVNRSTAISPPYDLDLSEFYSNLEKEGFQFNHDYRSNYPSTLTSNAALFTGQHHYFNYGRMENELFGARELIVGANPVLNTFKNNGYETNLVLQHSYLLLNFPEVVYDYVNIEHKELSVPLPDYYVNADYTQDLETRVNNLEYEKPQFFFIEILEPGHIPAYSDTTDRTKNEDDYKERLLSMTQKLNELVTYLSLEDPGAIIIIAADHGGFLGFDNTSQTYEELFTEPLQKSSMFGSLLAIKAPKEFRVHQEKIETSVGIFPHLFRYLAGLPSTDLELDDSSYIFIKSHRIRGVYKYFTPNGKPVTERLEL